MTKLIWRNLLRNKRRTVLTVGSVAASLVVLAFLQVVLAAMSVAESSTGSHRVVVRSAISLTFSLPQAYEARLMSIPNVEAITQLNWFQGIYRDTRPENMFPRFGTDPQTLFDVFPEIQITEEEIEAFRSERSGFIAGQRLVQEQGWKIGDRITIKGDIYPVDLDLVLRGIFTQTENAGAERMLYFHQRYVEEALGNPGQVSNYWLRIRSSEAVPGTIAAIEERFKNSASQVRAETEEAFALSFLQMFGNVRFLFTIIGLAVVVSILLITANTMAMGARQRTAEVAVLRTLGFRRHQVMGVVVCESLVVGVLGAALGCVVATILITGITSFLEQMGIIFGEIRVTPETLGFAMGIGVVVGLVSGLVPAVHAARLKIVDGLRRVT